MGWCLWFGDCLWCFWLDFVGRRWVVVWLLGGLLLGVVGWFGRVMFEFLGCILLLGLGLVAGLCCVDLRLGRL